MFTSTNKKKSFFERLTGIVDDSGESENGGGETVLPPKFSWENAAAQNRGQNRNQNQNQNGGAAGAGSEKNAGSMPSAPSGYEYEYEEKIRESGIGMGSGGYGMGAGAGEFGGMGMEEEMEAEGQLAVDVYQTRTEIVVQTMVAGVRPDDLNISITHQRIVISGKREGPHGIAPEDYTHNELYWGKFSRTVFFPQEVEPEEAEALEKHGLLIIRLPKVDKERQHKIKIKQL